MSVLRYHNKQELDKAIEILVKQVTPGELGAANFPDYVEKLVAMIRSTPHIFSGEALFMAAGKTGTLGSVIPDKGRGDRPGGKIQANVHIGERLNLTSLHYNDWKWIERTVKKHAKKHRFPTGDDYTMIKTRLVSEDENQWVAWATSDCVFSAILNVLGLRFKGSGQPVEGLELEIETRMADLLNIPKRVVQDVLMVYMIETRFGWPRMHNVKSIGLLNSETKAKANTYFLITYCENKTTDFWHTILGRRKDAGWELTDRQYERKFGSIRSTLPGDPDTEAAAWEVKTDSTLLLDLKGRLGIVGLQGIHRTYLKT